MSKLAKYVSVAFLLCSPVLEAQSIKVGKIKGNKALIEISEGELESGKVYQINTVESVETKGKATRRDNYVLGGFLYQAFTSKVGSSSSNTSAMALQAGYGWNKVNFEFGPVLDYTTTNDGTSTQTSWALAGEGVYNMVPHKPNTENLYGPGAQLFYGSGSLGSKTFALYGVNLFGFWKYFPKKVNFGIGTRLGLHIQTNNTDPASSSTGPYVQVQLLNYF